MKWTTDKPTKPGYYHYWGPVRGEDFKLKDHSLWPKTIALIPLRYAHIHGPVVYFLGSTCNRRLKRLPSDARWCGPIEEPE